MTSRDRAWAPDAEPTQATRESPRSAVATEPSRGGESVEFHPAYCVGPYEVRRLIGVGGMSEVFEGYDPRLNRSVAIKRLLGEVIPGPGAREHLRTEAQLAATLSHPRIVAVYDYVEAGGEDYLISELVTGQTLHQALAKTRTGAFPLERALQVGIAIAEALDHAHTLGIVHHDVKPSNVLVGQDASTIKLADFGIAARAQDAAEAKQGSVLRGTWSAMSPEQTRGEPTDPRSDLFSLGALLYQMISGVSPFAARTPLETLHMIRRLRQQPLGERMAKPPREISDLVDHLLEKSPGDRPESASEVLDVLSRSLRTLRQAPIRTASETAYVKQLAIVSCRLVATEQESILDPMLEFDALDRAHHHIQGGGGTILSIAGGHVLFYPSVQDNNCDAAVRSAVELREAISAATEGRLTTNIGVDFGAVTLALHGDRALATGSALDGAIALSGAARPGEIRASEAVQRVARGLFDLESLQDDSVPSFVVKGPKAVHSDRGWLTATPFVGQEQVLKRLDLAWSTASTGHTTALLLLGEPGLGKSRVVSEWMERHASKIEGRTLRLHGVESERFSPFAPWHRCARGLLGLMEGATAPSSSQIREGLRKLDLDDPEWQMLLGLLFRPEEENDQDRTGRSAEERRQQLIGGLVRLAQALGRRQPLLVVADDLHWMDQSSLAALQSTHRESGAIPLLLLMTARPEFDARWNGGPHLERVPVMPLDRWESFALVKGLTENTPLEPAVVRQLLASAEGNPLVLEELCAAAKTAASSGRPTSLRDCPTALGDSIHRKLESLGASLEAVWVAATLGTTFSRELLRRVLTLDERALQNHLRKLAGATLLQSSCGKDSTTCAFSHSLVRNAVYDSIPTAERRRLHHRIVAVLETDFEGELHRHPERYAVHYAQAGRPERALDLYEIAARRAARSSAHADARVHFEAALELVSSLPASEAARRERSLRVLMAPSIRGTEGWGSAEVEANLARIAALSDGRSELSTLWGLWSLGIVTHDEAQTQAALSAIDHCQPSRERTFVSASTHGVTTFYEGNFAIGRAHLVRASKLVGPLTTSSNPSGSTHDSPAIPADTLRDWGLEFAIAALVHLAWLDALSGDVEGALRAQRKAETLLLRVSTSCDKNEVRHGLYMRLLLGMTLRDYDYYDADEALEGRGALSHFIGLVGTDYPYYHAVARLALGRARLARGDHAALVDVEEAYAGIKSLAKANVGQVFFPTLVADACIEGGAIERCVPYVEEAVTTADTRYGRFYAPEAHRAEASLQMARGEFELARRALDRARSAQSSLALEAQPGGSLFERRIAAVARMLH